MQVLVKRDLVELGNGLFAYIQGDGSWGWSNSGLITADGESLMVDTLFTGRLTRDMLEAYRAATPAAARIGTLVNTHANGDHTFGNHLVTGARIIASRGCAEEMEERPAPVFAETMRRWAEHGEAGAFLHEVMGSRFDFSDIRHTPPTELFEGRRDVTVGGRRVELHEVGPAHTRGDILALVPDARTVYTGDIVFSGGHPIIWDGPVANWIDACRLILSWDVETVVPGHGPVGDKRAVRTLLDYLEYVEAETRKRHAAGLDWAEAAWDIAMDTFDDWLDRERIVANVAAIYRELSAGAVAPERMEVLALMGRYRRGEAHPHKACCGGHSHNDGRGG
ncbi:MAG: MBL fold metallo-hydrolase [Rhodobacteraceae bacterium]|nr:MBL fold metallo-hydrolase [Paracoccaceae bacterium]